MADISQNSVQNRYEAPVTPLLQQTPYLNRNNTNIPKVTFDKNISTHRGNVSSNINQGTVRPPTTLLKRKAFFKV